MRVTITPLTTTSWKHLEANPKSAYKQLFIKGTRLRAEVVYGLTVDGTEPMTPEEVAAEYGLPLEVIQEAIAYCRTNPGEIQQDHAAEEALLKATGMNDPSYTGTPRMLSAAEMARLNRL
jgi:uncharacterized protein (DUF433 family)